MKSILLFLSIVQCLLANTAITENDPSTLVNGVSMITGDLYLFDEDLVVGGVHPIRVQRGYLSNFGDWKPESHLRGRYHDLEGIFEITEANGTRLIYKKPSLSSQEKKQNKRDIPYRCITMIEKAIGMSNTASGVLSARTNYQNQYLMVEEGEKWLTLYTAGGSKRHYKVIKASEEVEKINGKKFINFSFALRSEEFPDGHSFEYKWDDNDHLTTIISKSPREKNYATLTFPSWKKKQGEPRQFQLTGSDQQSVHYHYCYLDKHEIKHWRLLAVEPPDEPKRHFTHHRREIRRQPFLEKITQSNGR